MSDKTLVERLRERHASHLARLTGPFGRPLSAEVQTTFSEAATAIVSLTRDRDEAVRERDELRRSSAETYRKLDEGTLHVVYCNGDHSKRVGAPDMICNCTLGREIKELRTERDALKAALAPFADDAAAFDDKDPEQYVTVTVRVEYLRRARAAAGTAGDHGAPLGDHV